MLEDRSARRWERHAVTVPVSVSLLVNGERTKFHSQATDISRGGLSLFMTREIAIGVRLQLDFVLPYSSTPMTLRGVVRTRTGFNHGVEFVRPTAEQQEAIERTCKVLTLLS
ncbi:MAG: PilZ domain-containing protein [Terriglobales bacterium]